VLDTCFSPVARVCSCRGIQRHFSLKQLLDSFFPRLAFHVSREFSFVPVAYLYNHWSISIASSSGRPHGCREIPRYQNLFLVETRRTTVIGPFDCSEIRFSRAPRIATPKLVNQRDTSCGHLFWTVGIDWRHEHFRFVCLLLAESDIKNQSYVVSTCVKR